MRREGSEPIICAGRSTRGRERPAVSFFTKSVLTENSLPSIAADDFVARRDNRRVARFRSDLVLHRRAGTRFATRFIGRLVISAGSRGRRRYRGVDRYLNFVL